MARLAEPRFAAALEGNVGTLALEGRVAIVTGAARGIGLATTRVLAKAGARVLMADIDEAETRAQAQALAIERLALSYLAVDVTRSLSVVRMIEETIRQWGRLDILVNNAAIPDSTAFEELSDDRWREVMTANLDSVLGCVRIALPYLRQSPCASIVNVASTQGILGQPNAVAYGTAKGGVVNLTRCMAVDFGSYGIRVNAVAPGFIDTRMALMADGAHEHQTDWFKSVYIQHGKIPLGRAGMPDDVAGVICFLASDLSRYMTGQVLAVDGGLTCTY